jgi:outer membrane receptor protein involved in Fe transport
VGPSTFGLGDDYFGGRLQAILPASAAYERRAGYPDLALNLNATYSLTRALSANVSLSYQDQVASGRLRDITLPAALVGGAALIFEADRFSFRLSINNLTNELYFTPNSPDVTGEVIVIPAPERNFVSSFSILF